MGAIAASGDRLHVEKRIGHTRGRCGVPFFAGEHRCYSVSRRLARVSAVRSTTTLPAQRLEHWHVQRGRLADEIMPIRVRAFVASQVSICALDVALSLRPPNNRLGESGLMRQGGKEMDMLSVGETPLERLDPLRTALSCG